MSSAIVDFVVTRGVMATLVVVVPSAIVDFVVTRGLMATLVVVVRSTVAITVTAVMSRALTAIGIIVLEMLQNTFEFELSPIDALLDL
ncbi:hypothetical protein MY10362_009740 [Beauveria mimosiformis]